MDSDTKRAKLDDGKPYVPPMGDLASRVGKALNKPAPRLMLTNGSAAPGASIKAAKYRKSLLLIILLMTSSSAQESLRLRLQSQHERAVQPPQVYIRG